jgi:uncharacterized protein
LIRSLVIGLAVPVMLGAAAQDFPEAVGYVNDFAGVIDLDAETQMQALCQELESKTGAELAVVTVSTVGDLDYSEYAIRLFEKWGIGKKGEDNGVMLFVTIRERRVRIDVGYGLEGVIPDITAGRILDDYVMPDLRRGDYSAGLLSGARMIAGVIAQNAGVEVGDQPPANLRSSRQRQQGSGIGKLLFMLFIFLIFARPRWLLPFLLMGSSGRRGGRWDGGFGGGFGGGGFGGGGFGGFGGFGGGSSGGGGAGRGF